MFTTYKTFNDPVLAKEFISQLEEAGIQYETEDDSKIFNPSFFNNEASRVIAVKIKQKDFQTTNRLFSKISVSGLDDINKDYYLFNMTEEELKEIIRKPDEWTQLDFELAHKLLKERGIEISITELEALNKKRINELSKPDKSLTLYIYLGWFFIIAGSIFWLIVPRFMYLFINIIGIIIGTGLYQSKKTLPDGQIIYRYNENDRKQGKLIVTIGLILVFISVISGFIIFNPYEF